MVAILGCNIKESSKNGALMHTQKTCAPNHIRKFFSVNGVHCASCEEIIKKKLENLQISYVKLHLDKDFGNLEICLDKKKVDFKDIKNALDIYEVLDNN
jgi:copper chaperone CopZ